MKKRKMNNKGISLIVLIITIIVMTILASTIILTLNSTNIFDKANQAVKVSDIQQVKQMAQTLWMEAYLNGAKADAEFEAKILEGLDGIDISKYLIIATTSGVEVEHKSNWEYGYTYSNDTWSGKVLKGNALEGNTTVKFYKSEKMIDPIAFTLNKQTYDLPNGNAYIMLIEGTGATGSLYDEEEDEYLAWQYDVGQFYLGEINTYELAYVTDIIIEDRVTIIPEQAFADARSLKRILIPNSVTSIGDLAFRECTSLSSITIPNRVTSIGSQTFYKCRSLCSITIPSSVTSITGNAFTGDGTTDVVVNYTGTEAQFNAIDKPNNWINSFNSITYNFGS